MGVACIQRTREGGPQSISDTLGAWTDIEFDTNRTYRADGNLSVPEAKKIRITETGYYHVSYYITSDHSSGTTSDLTMVVRMIVEDHFGSGLPQGDGFAHHGSHVSAGRASVCHSVLLHITATPTEYKDIYLQYRVAQNFARYVGNPLQHLGGSIDLTSGTPQGSAVSNFSVLRIDPDGVIPPLYSAILYGSWSILTSWGTIDGWSTQLNKVITYSLGDFTVPEPGLYKIGYSLGLYDTGLTSAYANRPIWGQVLKNGSTLVGSQATQGQHSSHGYTSVSHSFLADLDTGDDLKLQYRSPKGAVTNLKVTTRSTNYGECSTTFHIYKAATIGRLDPSEGIEDDIVGAAPGQLSTLPAGWSRNHSYGGVNPAIMVSWHISTVRSPHGGHAQCIAYCNEIKRTTDSPSANDGRITTTTYSVASGYSSYRLRGDVLMAGSASMLCQMRVLATALGALNTFTQAQMGGLSTNPTTWSTFDFAISASVGGRSDVYLDFWVNTINGDNNYEGVKFANIEIIGVVS